ncbi:MAG: hypothetical protein H0T18_08695 [Chloroflexia bacterium]|nr:hypothetical protein [Chloroflexia bacterium]
MTRYLTLFASAALAVVSFSGAVSAQTPVNADGSYVVASDDGVPIVSGTGTDINYGNIDTGGDSGEILGDPSAVYSPMVPDNPGPGQAVVMPGAGDGLIGGVPIAPAAPDTTTTTTTTLANTEGTAAENIPIAALVPTEPAPVATDSAATTGGFCTQYGSWYDAQIAYENLGGTAADPALVQEVDPNYDGIACEEYMV